MHAASMCSAQPRVFSTHCSAQLSDVWWLLQVANARELEGSKGMLGVVNWASEKLLNAAHRGRSNTRAGE